jgi:leader peptidase (prepilin peptidase) / N-methyltransferase
VSSAMLDGAFFAVAGLLIGSFLTVVVDRVPRGASVVRPGSACGSCDHRLTPIELVPVLSWLFLRGRCRSCGAPIGVESVLIEIVTASLFVALAARFESNFAAAAFCVFAAALVGQTVIDIHTKRLPREVTYVAIAIGFPLLTVAAVVDDAPRRIWMALLGAAIATAVMAVLYAVSRGGMGDGDVRLSPMLGLYLGWLNPGLAPIGLFIGFFVGAVVGVALMVVGRVGRRTAVPFGPSLAVGAVAAVWIGQDLIDVILAR